MPDEPARIGAYAEIERLERQRDTYREALKFELDAALGELGHVTAGMPPERARYYIDGAPKIKRLRRALGIADQESD